MKIVKTAFIVLAGELIYVLLSRLWSLRNDP